jgi:large subunit ribosomal protein L24
LPIAARSRLPARRFSGFGSHGDPGHESRNRGGAVEGDCSFASAPNSGSRLEAELKAERLDLDATMALVRSLAARKPSGQTRAQLSLDIGRAISAGQELRPLLANRLRPEDDHAGSTDNRQPACDDGRGGASTGSIRPEAGAEFEARIARSDHCLIAPLAPALTSRLNAMGGKRARRSN